MDRQRLSFRELIAPIEADRFIAEYYRQKPLHVPGAADKFAEIFTWGALNELLSMTTLWSDQTLELAINGRSLVGDHYC